MKKKILILTDFSPAAHNALKYTQLLFEGMPADFHLVNAYRVEPDLLKPDLYVAETAERLSEQHLEQLLDELLAEDIPANHTYQIEAVAGSPQEVAASLQAGEHYDIVVAGASRTETYEWLGNMATGLIRHLKTNVLIVPESFLPKPVEHLLLASDFHSFNDINNLQVVKDLARLHQARLTLLKVFDPAAEKQLDQTAKDLHRHQFLTYFESVPSDFFFVQDPDPAAGINTYLAGHPAELLVTVPHHISFWDALTGRSLTRKLACHLTVPMLAVYDPNRPDASELDPESQYRATIL